MTYNASESLSPLLSALKAQFHAEGELEIAAVGTSMYPFIRHGDRCRFVCFCEQNLRPGDILLYVADERLIGHRLHSMSRANEHEVLLWCKGDANLHYDPPISIEQVVGKLVSVKKRGVTLRMKGFICTIWTWLVLWTPAYAKGIRKYLNARHRSGMSK